MMAIDKQSYAGALQLGNYSLQRTVSRAGILTAVLRTGSVLSQDKIP